MKTALIFAACCTLAADWPQLHGPNRDGRSDEKLGVPGAELRPKWSIPVGSGWSAAVVAGGKVYLFHRIEAEELLEALDPTTGKRLWKSAVKTRYRDDFEFDDGPRATPIVTEKRIFTFGADSDLTAHDLDGKRLWTLNVNATYRTPKGFFGSASTPILVGGKLLVNVGAANAAIVAFDPETGKELWKAGNEGVSYSSPVAATIDGVEQAVFFTRAGLLVVTVADGKVTYQHPWRPRLQASVNAASPIVRGQEVFLTTSYNTGAILLKLAKGECTEVWKSDDVLSCHYNTPVRDGDFLYGIDGRQEGGQAKFRCVEWATGKVRWTEKMYGCATLTIVGDRIIGLAETGELRFCEKSAEKYRSLGNVKLFEAPVRAAFAVSGGSVYARDSKSLLRVDLPAR